MKDYPGMWATMIRGGTPLIAIKNLVIRALECRTNNTLTFLSTSFVFQEHVASKLFSGSFVALPFSPITGDGNKPIPLAQQVRQRLDQQFEGLEEYGYRLEPRTGWRFLSFFLDAFIFVITLATKQRLEVTSKLGFVANIILG